MKKIIAAIDGLKYSESAAMYAVQLAKSSNAHLIGIFLDDFTYHSYKIYDLIASEGVPSQKAAVLEKNDRKVRTESVKKFEAECHKAGLSYSIHHDRSIAIQELLHESIYADLLIIDKKETLTSYTEKIPTHFIRDLLGDVQCPVLLVPKKYKPINKVVLLFDGTPSSVYAIKMFSYLLSSLKVPQLEVFSVKSEDQTMYLPDNKLMKEFMKQHFQEVEYHVALGNTEEEIWNHLKSLESPLVVLGAYHRGRLSRWLKKSMADFLMKRLNAPLFIAHNK
jgi:nucleotide-binding universal stress UspA family protein